MRFRRWKLFCVFLISAISFAPLASARIINFRTSPSESSFGFNLSSPNLGPNSIPQHIPGEVTASTSANVSELTLQYDTDTQMLRFVDNTASFANTGLAYGQMSIVGPGSTLEQPPEYNLHAPAMANVAGEIRPGFNNPVWAWAVRGSGVVFDDDWFPFQSYVAGEVQAGYTGGHLHHSFFNSGYATGSVNLPGMSSRSQYGWMTQLGPTDFSLVMQVNLPGVAVSVHPRYWYWDWEGVAFEDGHWDLEVTPEVFGSGAGQLALYAYSVCAVGDFNCNGEVDSADYVLWRKSFGQMGANLPADDSGPLGVPDGLVDEYDYEVWRANFGDGYLAASGTSMTISNVPEPTAPVLVGIMAFAVMSRRHKSFRVLPLKSDF